MIDVIVNSLYKKMPWKNKRGVTLQVCMEPPNSSFENLDFDYRLSSAPVHEDCEFSKFPGYSRILMPIRGKGFYLNGALYELHEVSHFSGDELVHCQLNEGEVVDLGLIYNPQKISANVKVLNFKGSFSLNSQKNTRYLIYILRGNLSVNNHRGSENDTFVIGDTETLNLETTKNTTLALFQLHPAVVTPNPVQN